MSALAVVLWLDVRLATCVRRLGVTSCTSVGNNTLMASGGKALAAEAPAETIVSAEAKRRVPTVLTNLY